MCAASRAEESRRPDALFVDPMAHLLAGDEGRAAPMGEWILVPRTRRGDDFLVTHYRNGCRQLVLLGAGMDARAHRAFAASADAAPPALGGKAAALGQLKVFEVDQPTTFAVKEPLLADMPLAVASRNVVRADFARGDDWAANLVEAGFDATAPTVWLLEGLVYYLRDHDVNTLLGKIGKLSAPGSAVFHDSITKSYVSANIAPGGAPFVSGSDDYGALWRAAGFDTSIVRDLATISVDRRRQRLAVSNAPGLTPERCRGQRIVLFVEAVKTGACANRTA